MNIFVYEFLSGGGLFFDGDSNSIDHQSGLKKLAEEGIAMANAVIEDFLEIENDTEVNVYTSCDQRIWNPVQHDRLHVTKVDAQNAHSIIRDLAIQCDHTLVIAPEIDHILYRIVEELEDSNISLLGPNSDFIKLASDKFDCFRVWSDIDCPTIETSADEIHEKAKDLLQQKRSVLLKPRFGAGSYRLTQHESVESLQVELDFAANDNVEMVLQPYVEGLPVSVAAVISPSLANDKTLNISFLPACEQTLGEDFAYLGGRLPIDEHLNVRAQQVAQKALSAFPTSNGYIGIDVLLGKANDGSDDKVVEINPRLTTSYIGLRSACNENLAESMLASKSNRPTLTFSKEPTTFNATGILECHES